MRVLSREAAHDSVAQQLGRNRTGGLVTRKALEEAGDRPGTERMPRGHALQKRL